MQEDLVSEAWARFDRLGHRRSLRDRWADPLVIPDAVTPLDLIGVLGDLYLDLEARYYGQRDDRAYLDYREVWHLYMDACVAYLEAT